MAQIGVKRKPRRWRIKLDVPEVQRLAGGHLASQRDSKRRFPGNEEIPGQAVLIARLDRNLNENNRLARRSGAKSLLIGGRPG